MSRKYDGIPVYGMREDGFSKTFDNIYDFLNEIKIEEVKENDGIGFSSLNTNYARAEVALRGRLTRLGKWEISIKKDQVFLIQHGRANLAVKLDADCEWLFYKTIEDASKTILDKAVRATQGNLKRRILLEYPDAKFIFRNLSKKPKYGKMVLKSKADKTLSVYDSLAKLAEYTYMKAATLNSQLNHSNLCYKDEFVFYKNEDSDILKHVEELRINGEKVDNSIPVVDILKVLARLVDVECLPDITGDIELNVKFKKVREVDDGEES